jgi:transposase InsO family protein
MGHWGVGKTLHLLAKNYFWSGMSTDVKNYIARCDACQHERASFKIRTGLHPLPIARLWSRISLDLVGPLVKTRSGNEYLVVAVDAYSKYVIAAAIPNKLSSTTAKFFYEQVICRASCPETVRTDNGSEFLMEFDELCNKYGIKHENSSPHRPSANGQVERMNQSIVHSIRRSLNLGLNTWDDHVATTVYGFNITVQSSTGFSPYFLLYNREPRIGDKQDVVAIQQKELTHHMEQIRTEDNTVTTTAAIENLTKAQDRMIKAYDRRRPMDQKLFDTGSMVLIKSHTKANKLQQPVEGPFMLKAYNTDHTLVQISDAKGRTWTEHSSHIVPYLQQEQPETHGQDKLPAATKPVRKSGRPRKPNPRLEPTLDDDSF